MWLFGYLFFSTSESADQKVLSTSPQLIAASHASRLLTCSSSASPQPTKNLKFLKKYLALPDGAGRFPQDFSGLAVLRNSLNNTIFDEVSPSVVLVSTNVQLYLCTIILWSYNPGYAHHRCAGLGLFAFARHYLRNFY